MQKEQQNLVLKVSNLNIKIIAGGSKTGSGREGGSAPPKDIYKSMRPKKREANLGLDEIGKSSKSSS